MNAAVKVMLVSNLRSLKLATMLKHLEEKLRQTKEAKLPYEEFLLNLTEIEVQVRKENGCQRRIKESHWCPVKI